jgi:hypothetical protein
MKHLRKNREALSENVSLEKSRIIIFVLTAATTKAV